MMGRKRKPGLRYANGQLKKKSRKQRKEAAENIYAVLRKAELLGGDMLKAKDARSGTAIGRMFLRGEINIQQYDAGLRLEQDWRRFNYLAGIPPHYIPDREITGTTRSASEQEWNKAKRVFFEHLTSLKKGWGSSPGIGYSRAMNLLTAVIMADNDPNNEDEIKIISKSLLLVS